MSVSVIERGTNQFYNLLKCAPNIYTKSKYIRYRNITKTPSKHNLYKDINSLSSFLNILNNSLAKYYSIKHIIFYKV